MSLLMDALKQQQGPATAAAPPVSGGFWRPLAIVLLIVLGLACGFALAYWLGQASPAATTASAQTAAAEVTAPRSSAAAVPAVPTIAGTVANSEPVSSLPPAHPGLILSDLLAVPAADSFAPDADEQLVISATPQQDSFTELPAMAEAEVGLSADEQTAAPQSAPELSAEQVPEALRQKFQYAIEATNQSVRKPQVTEHAAPARDVRALDELLQRQIPPLRFEAHIYASDPKKRWVKVNGKDLQEGQWVTADIQLKEITPNYVLLQTGRQLFSMESLSEWSYRLPAKR